MRTRFGFRIAVLIVAVLPLLAIADEGQIITGGGEGSLGADVDGDGEMDGAYFGIGATLQDEGASGHLVYGMWGNTDVEGLPVFGLEGQITGADRPPGSDSVLLTGSGTVDLGEGVTDSMRELPFEAFVTPGRADQGSLQVTIIGALDGALGDTVPDNGNYEMPAQAIASGQITLQPALEVETVDRDGSHVIAGGGLTTFGTDLDDDGDVDGAYFGLGLDLQGGEVEGHFVCAMWGDTEYWGLPLMAIEGVVDSISIGSDTGNVFRFSGVGTVDLGSDEGFFTGVPFHVNAKAGGPEDGELQLTIVGVLDGVPGDTVTGNNACDLPLETISSGLIAFQAAPQMTAVLEEPGISTPKRFVLEENVPNPFNPSTTIRFSLPHRGRVVLRVLNGDGQEIDTLVDEELAPGTYRTEWIPGEAAASGVYYYRLRTERAVETKKMLFLK